MAQDKRSQLYNNLIQSGKVTVNEIGSPEQFSQAIRDEQTARQFYKNLINSGKLTPSEIGDEDAFYGSISSDFSVSVPSNASRGQVAAVPQRTEESQSDAVPAARPNFLTKMTDSLRTALNGVNDVKADGQQVPYDQKATANDSRKAFYENRFIPTSLKKGVAEMVGDDPYVSEGEKKAFSDEIRTRLMARATPEQRREMLKRQYLDEANKAFDEALAKQIDAETIANNKKQVDKMRQEFVNAYIDEADKQYQPMLDEVREMEQQEQEQRDAEKEAFLREHPQYDKTRYADIEEKYNRPLEEGESAELRQEFKRLAKEERYGELKKEEALVRQTNAEIEEKRLQRRLDEAEQRRKESAPLGDFRGFIPSEEEEVLQSALRQRQKEIRIIQAERDDAGFLQGIADAAVDPSFWTLGLSDVSTALRLNDIKNNIESGKELTESQKMLLDATVGVQEAEGMYSNNRGFWYNAANVTVNAVPFVGEFILTGGGYNVISGAFKAGGKALAKNVSNRLANAAIRYTGTAIGDIASALTMATTTGGARTLADIEQRYLGQVEKTDDGYMFVDGEDWGEAITDGLVANTLEYYTEKLGGHLDFVGKGISRLAGRAGRKLGIDKGIEKLGLSKLSPVLTRIKGSDFFQQGNALLRKGGVHELPSEVIEEEANILLNAALVGDNQFSDLWDAKTQLDLVGGLAVSIGFMRALPIAGGVYKAGQYYRYKHATDVADTVANYRLTEEKWAPLKEQIDNATNEEFGGVLQSVIDNPSLEDQEKESVADYAIKLLKMRGYNLGTIADAKDRIARANDAEPDETVADAANDGVERGYQEGYQTANAAARKQYADEADAAAEQVRELFDEDDQQRIFGDDYTADYNTNYYLAHRDEYTDEQIMAAVDYYQKRARVEGMMDGAENAADLQVQQENAKVRSNTHQGTGQVITATRGGEQFYVVGGDIVTDPETGLDTLAGTGGAVVVKNTQTGEVKVLSPQELSIQSVQDAQQLIDYNENELRQQLMQQAENDMTYGEPANEVFMQDDEVQLKDADGNIIIGTIGMLPDTADGKFIVQTTDGQALPFTEEELNRMVVSHNGQEISHGLSRTNTEEDASAEQEQSGNLDNAGGEASVENGTGANDPSASAPSTPSADEAGTVEDSMPMIGEGEDAEPDFTKATSERAHRYIYNEAGLTREESDQFVDANKKEADKALEKLTSKPPKMGASLAKYRKEKAEWQASIDAAQQRASYWQEVKDRQTAIAKAEQEAAFEEQQREAEGRRQLLEDQRTQREKMQTAKRIYGDYLDDDLETPHDATELVVLNMPRNLAWDDVKVGEHTKRGLQKELGLKRGFGKRSDTTAFNPYLAAKGKGIGIDDAVNAIYRSSMNELANGEKRFDDQEIKSALLDLLYYAQTPADIRDYVVNNRVAQAEAVRAAEDEAAKDAEMQAWAEHYHLTPEEREAFEEYIIRLGEEYSRLTDDEVREIMSIFADANLINEEYEQNRRSEEVDRQPVERGAGSESGGSQGEVRGQGADTEPGSPYRAGQGTEGAETATVGPVAVDDNVSGGARGVAFAPSEQLKPTDLRDAVRSESPEIGVNEANARARALTNEEAEALMQRMEASATTDPQISLTPETWAQTFGLNNSLETPIGNVKMGEGQYQKFFDKSRSKEFGMAVETLRDPDVVMIEPSQAKEGQNTERPYSYIFVKTFDRNGEKVKYYASVTVQRDNMEVSVSSHYMKPAKVLERLTTLERLYTKETLLPNSSEWHLAEQQDAVPDLLPTQENNVTSERKVTENISNEQEKSKKSSIQGLKGYDVDEVLNAVRGEIEIRLEDADLEDITIKGMALHGSRMRGDARDDSDLDVVVEYEGDISEDGLFNILNEDPIEIEGIRIDVNPITKFKSGTLEEYMKRSQRYDEEKSLKKGKLLYRFSGGAQTEQSPATVSVTTPQTNPGVENEDVIAELSEPAQSDAAADASKPQTPNENGGEPINAETQTEDLSEGKDTENISNEQEKLGKTSTAEEISAEEAKVNTNPTEGQKEAGNYRMGHIKVNGLDISIENPKGSIRRGTDTDGNEWETTMHNTYGYIRGTTGADKDHIDVFLSDDPTRSDKVFIVQQRKKVNGTWKFDELKVLLGFDDAAQASNAYLSNYKKGWDGMSALIETDMESFKEWLKNGNQKGTYKEDGTWAKIYPGVSTMVADEGEMPEPEQQEVQILRWKGDNRLSGMGGELSEVPGGHGQTSTPQSDSGQNRREQGLLQGELQVDGLDNTIPEPKDSPLSDLQRQNDVNATVGRGNGASARENKIQNPDVPLERRENTGNSRRNQGQLQNDNISGQNNENGGLGEGTQSELQNAEEQTETGLANGKNSRSSNERIAQPIGKTSLKPANGENTLNHQDVFTGNDGKDLPLQKTPVKSWDDEEGNHHEGLEEELERLEHIISADTADTDSSVGSGRAAHNAVASVEGAEAVPVEESQHETVVGERERKDGPHNRQLRRRAALIRAEISRRERSKEDLRNKYNINKKGDITLDDLARMFRDLNSNPVIGFLFERVYETMKRLKLDFRFTDNLRGGVNGSAITPYNMTFYDWDALTRGSDNQEKARILLHEMIHNVTSQALLFSRHMPHLLSLTSRQFRAARKLAAIYKQVKEANPKRANGKDFYGLTDVDEMVAELANPEFRDALDRIVVDGRSLWQRIKDAIRDFFGLGSEDVAESNALKEAGDALEEILDSYGLFNTIRHNAPRQILDAGQRLFGDGTSLVDDMEADLAKRKGNALAKEDIFVSNAMKAVEDIKQEKATPEQWLAMITKAGGLKAGEDKWLGLSEWLASPSPSEGGEKKPRTITKQEVLDFIRKNQIEIEEDTYTEHPQGFEELKREYDQWLHDEGYDYAWEQLRERFGDDAEIAFGDMGGELTIDNGEAASVLLGSEKPINDTRLDYTTEGLQNKREIALVVPTVEPWNESDEIHFGDAGEGRAVAWVRFGETTDKDGKKVLVIDEIQSKRHQEGREKGYYDEAKTKRLYHELDELQSKRYDITERQKAIYEEIASSEEVKQMLDEDGYIKPDSRARYNEIVANNSELKELEKQWITVNNEIAEAQRKWRESYEDTIPDAPFEKNWHELAMKRMLRYAAENGYDKVAWTKGEQQAERYNIGNAVNRITVSKVGDGQYRVDTWGNEGRSVEGASGEMTSEQMVEIFGKELSVRLMTAADNNKEPGPAVIAGDGLRIGGEGMKGFYDDMLPRFMNKYGKKWNVKVGEVELPNVEEAGRTMWSVDVTPEMKEGVLQSQPMFRDGEDDVEAVKDYVLSEFKQAAQSEAKGRRIPIGKLTTEGKAYLESLSGLTMKPEVTFSLNASELRHVYNEHYGNNEKDKGNNIPLTDEDIRSMVDVITNPDRVVYGVDTKDGRKLFYFLKDSQDGTYNLAEVYSDKHGNLSAKTFYKTKKGSNLRADELMSSPTLSTSETSGASLFSGAKIPKLFEISKKTAENLREGETPSTEKKEEPKRTAKQQRDREAFAQRQWRRAHERAKDWVEKLGLTDKVTVVDSIDELPGAKDFYQQKRNAKGWYDPRKDRIVIVLGNHRSPDDVVKTILHEAVAHHGLRQLFGKHFDQFLDNVYENATIDIKHSIERLANDKLKGDVRKATEEYLARLAEDTDFERAIDRGWFQKIKEAFLNMLSKLGLKGFNVELTDNELRYLLWRSYENLAEPGRYRNVFQSAKDVSMQSRLHVGNYARIVRMGYVEDEIPQTVMNWKDEEKIRQRVKQMSAAEAAAAYRRINAQMLDEDGLDFDEHNEKIKYDWIAKHGLQGVGKVMADDLQAYTDKYGSGIIELRWALQDRLEELGVDVASVADTSAVADGDVADESESENDVNEQFNKELQQQIEGTLPKGHVYKLGMPSAYLQSTGIPNLPIRLQSSVLGRKSVDPLHRYNLEEVKDLVRLIQKPIAIFSYGDKDKAQNLMIGISQNKDDGRQFLVGLSINPTVNGKELEINSVRNVFPKNFRDWIHWINQGKMLRVDGKKEIEAIIDALRINPVDYISNDDLNSAAKIVENFENPKLSEENFEDEEENLLFMEGDDVTDDVNEQFNKELSNLTEENADSVVLSLGRPSAILRAAGVEDKPLRLYGSKLMSKLKKHGYNTQDVRNLPLAVSDPIAVFKGSHEGSFAILTELNINGNNVLATLSTGKGGNDVDFNIITSVYGKRKESVLKWIADNKLLYANKEKTLNYLHHSAPIAEALSSPRSVSESNQIDQQRRTLAEVDYLDLNSAAKIVENFENPKLSEENFEDEEENLLFREGDDGEETAVNVARRIYEDAIRDTGDRMMIPALLWTMLPHKGRKEKWTRFKHKFAESYFDYSRSIKALQDAIEEATNRKIEGFEDVWRALNSKSSIDSVEIQRVMHDYIEPMSEFVGEMIEDREIDDHQMELDDVEKYMNAVHGLERNPAMAMKQAQDEYDEDVRLLKQQLENGELSDGERKSLEFRLLKKEARFKGIKHYMDNEDIAHWFMNWQREVDYAHSSGEMSDVDYEKKVKQIKDEYENGWQYKYRGRDYSGLTALFSDEFNGKKPTEEQLEQAARDYVAKFEDIVGKDQTDELWKYVKALNSYSLKKSYESGLLSKEQYQNTLSMYEHYVPLRGWHDKYAGDVYQYISRGEPAEVLQGVLKKAYGRTSRAARVFGTMAAMANTAIVQGNKNLVAQRLLNMALNHKDSGLLMVGEQWYQKTADGNLIPMQPDIREGMSADEMREELESFEERMKAEEERGNVVSVRTKFKNEMPLHMAKWQERQHCVRVMRGGKEYLVYVLGNPRAAMAFNGLLNPNSQPGALSNVISRWMRHLAKFQTSLNPEFLLSNFERDVMTASTSAYTKFGNDYRKQFAGNLTRVMPLTRAAIRKLKGKKADDIGGIFSLFRKYDAGTLDKNNEMERLFKEFVDFGGMTGISYITKSEEYQASMEKVVKRMREGKLGKIRNGWDALGDNIEFLNKGIENATRFATYMTSRQRGRTVRESVFDAKEASVNFNMKGSGAWGNMLARRLYLYVNPAMQALRMLGEWYANDPNVAVRKGGAMVAKTVSKRFLKAAAMTYVASILSAVINELLSQLLGHGGDDDDKDREWWELHNGKKSDWWALSEWNRYNYMNVISPFSKGYFHWSLPQELRPLWAMGQITVDMLTGHVSPQRGVHSMALQLNNLSPLSFFEGGTDTDESVISSEIRALTPSFVSPFTNALLWNRDFMGHKITNQNAWNKDDPEWKRAGKDTPGILIKGSKKWNELTGGRQNSKGWGDSPYLNPSVLYYVTMQQFGGLGSMASRLLNLIDEATDSEQDVDLRNLPFFSKLYVSTGDDYTKDRVMNEKFWMYYNEYKAAEYEMNKDKKQVASGEMSQADADKTIRARQADGSYHTWEVINDNALKYVYEKVEGTELEKEVKQMVVDAVENGKVPDWQDKLERSSGSGMYNVWLEAVQMQRDARIEKLDDAEVAKEFDKSDDPFERQALAKRISTDAGASKDPYGDKPNGLGVAYYYQLNRTAEDVREDALLYARQQKAKKAGDDELAKQLENERKNIRTDLTYLHGGRSDETIMNDLRKWRRRLLKKYGLVDGE